MTIRVSRSMPTPFPPLKKKNKNKKKNATTTWAHQHGLKLLTFEFCVPFVSELFIFSWPFELFSVSPRREKTETRAKKYLLRASASDINYRHDNKNIKTRRKLNNLIFIMKNYLIRARKAEGGRGGGGNLEPCTPVEFAWLALKPKCFCFRTLLSLFNWSCFLKPWGNKVVGASFLILALGQ